MYRMDGHLTMPDHTETKHGWTVDKSKVSLSTYHLDHVAPGNNSVNFFMDTGFLYVRVSILVTTVKHSIACRGPGGWHNTQ